MAWGTNGGKQAIEAAKEASVMAYAAENAAQEAFAAKQLTLEATANSKIETDYIKGKRPLIEQSIVDAAASKTQSANAVVVSGAAKTTAETVRGEFDRVVAEAGSNNPEVVQARGGEVNLGVRMDKVTTQLAEKANQTDIVKADGISIVVDDTGVLSAIGTSGGGVLTNFDPETTYAASDIITFMGKLYVSRVSFNVGNVPSALTNFWREYDGGAFEITEGRNLYSPGLAKDGQTISYGKSGYTPLATSSVLGRFRVEKNTTYTISTPNLTHPITNRFICLNINGEYLGVSSAISTYTVAAGITDSLRRVENGRSQRTFTIHADSEIAYVDTSLLDPAVAHTTESFEELRKLIQIEKGVAFTSFEPHGTSHMELKSGALPVGAISELNMSDDMKKGVVGGIASHNDLVLLKNTLSKSEGLTITIDNTQQDSDIAVRTPFNTESDLVHYARVLKNDGRNNVINLLGARLIPNSSADAYSIGVNLQSATDDATPPYFNGDYAGANHGYSKVIKVTLTNHGKTFADIGSEWTDNVNSKFYIIKIIDSNALWILGTNTASVDSPYSSTKYVGGSLIHVNGAVNTTTLAGFTYASDQLIPTTKNVVKTVLLDGIKKVFENGTYAAKYVDIAENYDLVNPFSMLERLIANKPVNGYTKNPSLEIGDAVATISNVHRILSDGTMLVVSDFINFSNITFRRWGLVQQQKPIDAYNGGVHRTIPKTLPITIDSIHYDLRTPRSLDLANPALNYTPEYWEVPSSPPDRSVDLFKDRDNNNKVGFALGYLPSEIRKSNLSNAWLLNSTKKSYPNFISHDTDKPLPKDSITQGVAYRKYYDLETARDNISFYHIPLGDVTYVYIDAFQSFDDFIKLPSEFMGKKIEVIEKTENVVIFGNVVTGRLRIKVSEKIPMFGYAVLKITTQ